jgi:LmbE family N-acetylglucosaminyl deacetylase
LSYCALYTPHSHRKGVNVNMRVLILSPHTDDAELGCGGYIARLVEEGHDILWIVFSASEESIPESLPKYTLLNEFQNVIEYLGLGKGNYKILPYKVRRFNEKRQDILEDLVKIKRDFKPNLVIMPSMNDYHQDHHVVSNEAFRAFKKDASIIGYELPWNHVTFNTVMFVRLEKSHIDTKFNLLENYKSQKSLQRDYFSQDFIFGLARVRGIQCNAQYAEAYEVMRWIMY